VTQVSPTYVRIAITGVEGVPTAQLATNERGLVITSVPSTTTVTEEQDEDEVEITVTGDRPNLYRASNSTTATRTDTPLRDIPQSIQVVPQEVIKDQGITRITDAVRNVSGASIQSGYGNLTSDVNLRGFVAYTTLKDGFTTQPFFTDGGNIEQVEVLKGPASVLYGSLEPGGVMSPRNP
jgi:iron complex outermembrane recepter protein